MSKNALKRLRKRQQWEEEAEDRQKRRKEKRTAIKARKREQRQELLAQGVDKSLVYPQKPQSTLVPVALVIDCDFESYMMDKERLSISSQVTRAYSDNKNARYKAHLWMAGWKGKLVERFETKLDNTHLKWAGVGFTEGDFVEASLKAEERMKSRGGKMIESLQKSIDSELVWARDEKDPFPLPDPEPVPAEEHKNIVYLTSESPYTLERLEPHTSYVIGGIVDKNREKGLCYRRARERGIRTAKLPIGQFMVMQSRSVLATNHVVEIMLKWLEYEDWGQAFTAVIPKRKGGVLKGQNGEAENAEGDEENQNEDERDATAELNKDSSEEVQRIEPEEGSKGGTEAEHHGRQDQPDDIKEDEKMG